MERAVMEAARTYDRGPKCIGYFLDNDLAWGYEGLSSPVTLPRTTLKAPARPPAKGAFVGAHWFEYVDEPLTGRSLDGENYNIGLVSVADVPYPELTTAMRSTNSTLYKRLLPNAH